MLFVDLFFLICSKYSIENVCNLPGQFLELDSLTYKVESLIESQINVSTYLRILSWANESFGSKYIRRCCLLFMEECWFHLVQDNGYYAIPLECLVEIVQSDFTQVKMQL